MIKMQILLFSLFSRRLAIFRGCDDKNLNNSRAKEKNESKLNFLGFFFL